MSNPKPTTASKSLDLATEIEHLKGVVAALEERLERLEAATHGAPSLSDFNDFERTQNESQKEAENAEPKRRHLTKPAPPNTLEQREIEAQTGRFVKEREQNLRILDAALVAVRQAARQEIRARGAAEEDAATWVPLPSHITPPLSPDDIPHAVTEVYKPARPEEDAATQVPSSYAPPLSPDDIPHAATELSETAPRARPPSGPIPVDDTADIELIALRWSGGK
jgi:hypothetical protein